MHLHPGGLGRITVCPFDWYKEGWKTTEARLANVLSDRSFTAENVAKVLNVKGEQLSAETYYFRPNQVLGWHKHPESEQVFFIIEGSGTFFLERPDDTERHAVDRGSIIIVPANAWHSMQNTGNCDLIACQATHLPVTTVQKPIN